MITGITIDPESVGQRGEGYRGTHGVRVLLVSCNEGIGNDHCGADMRNQHMVQVPSRRLRPSSQETT